MSLASLRSMAVSAMPSRPFSDFERHGRDAHATLKRALRISSFTSHSTRGGGGEIEAEDRALIADEVDRARVVGAEGGDFFG